MDIRHWMVRGAVAAGAFAAAAGSALAGPRDSATFVNVNSDGGTPGTQAFAAPGGYTARWITVQGTLAETVAATFGSEAIIVVTMPTTEQFVLQPLRVSNFVGSTQADFHFELPEPVAAAGTWTFSFRETYDDGAGPDAQWTSVKITLNDGPPAVADAGLLPNGVTRYPATAIGATEVKWYAFTLAYDVSAGAMRYLDIDTEGTSISTLHDTEITLFDSKGRQVGYDDDDGNLNASQLSFGAGTRPAVGSSALYDGRDGALPAGRYFIAVRSFGGPSPQLGWGWSGGGGIGGTVRVNINTNAGSSMWCPGDFDKSGAATIDDIFIFLNAWFSGCP